MGSSSPEMLIKNNGDVSAATLRRRVGLIYDERMCKHSTPRGEEHPENPNRIRAIWDMLLSANIPQRCVVLKGKEAEEKFIAAVHTKKHIDLIKTISFKKMDSRRKKVSKRFDSIYFNEGSSEAACLSAGSLVKVAEKVANGELDSAFAIVRPPGHHAEEHVPMGFCLYNNVAIATSFLLNERKDLGINKILIVDWDVHHGNGTQKMFWKDPRVLFFSVHRYESGSFYPGGDDGSHIKIGEGPGVGYNINVPWENASCGDADYIAVWDHILIPVAKEFNPDMVIISAGFDAAVGDPLGDCCVTPYGFSVMLKKLMEFSQGKVVMALEGGYNLDSLAKSVLACVEVLLEDKPINGSSEVYPLESTWQVIQMVREELSPFWPILAEKIPDMLSTTKITPQKQVLSSDSDGDSDGGPNTAAKDLEEDLIKPLSDLMVEEDNHGTQDKSLPSLSLRLPSDHSNINPGKVTTVHPPWVSKVIEDICASTKESIIAKHTKAMENEIERTCALIKETIIARYSKDIEQMKVKYVERGKRHVVRMFVARGFRFDLKSTAETMLVDEFAEEARAFHHIVPYSEDVLKELAEKDAHEGREPWPVPALDEVNFNAILDGNYDKLVMKDRLRAVLLKYLAEMYMEDQFGENARHGHSVVPYSEEELKELAEKDAREGREPWPVPPVNKVNIYTILDELCNVPEEVGKDQSNRIAIKRRWRRQQRDHTR